MTTDEALAYAKEKGFELYLLFGRGGHNSPGAKATLRDISKSKAGGYYSHGENAVYVYATAKTEAEAIVKAVDDPDNLRTGYVTLTRLRHSPPTLDELDL